VILTSRRRAVAGRLAIVFAVVGLATVLGPSAGASVARPQAAAPVAGAARADFAGLVDIGGRRLYLECRGKGKPTVVFESGFGNTADIWSYRQKAGSRTEVRSRTAVLPAVARFTRVCAYDRPGTSSQSGQPSRSDPVDMPRSPREIVADLHALLDAGVVRGPYVLVGHSMGGLLARLYAGTYPGDVAGFVSVDAAHEIYYEAYQELLTPEQYTPPAAEIDIVATAIEMRQARVAEPLRPMPMVVLEHSRDRGRFPNPFGAPPDFPIAALERAFQESQDDLATLVPGTQHVIARRSEHYIQVSQPGLVVDATRAVVDAVRHGDPRVGSLRAH
jgi:pimeloyl-ACP methyl ester carboxylesterase